MQVTLQRPTLEERSFEIIPGDLLLVVRARESYPVLGIFQEISVQCIERDVGRGHERKRLVLQPALTLEPCATVYGGTIPRVKFQKDLSFGLGTEIADIFVGKQRVLQYLQQRNGLVHYAELFSHLPDQGPYDPKQFLY